MTTPVIDVDFAIPSASVAVGTPAVDVAIPGLTGPPGSSSRFITFGAKGPVTPRLGELPFFPRMDADITKVTIALGHQDSGTTTVDVNVDGVTVYTNQANRGSLNGALDNLFQDAWPVDAPHIGQFSYLTVDVDAAGVGAQDLVVTVEYEPT